MRSTSRRPQCRMGGLSVRNGAVLAMMVVIATSCSVLGISAKPPAAPTETFALPGATSLAVNWTPPNNRNNISGYTATAQPGGKTCTASARRTSCAVDGLTPGKSYTVAVRTIGPGGSSSSSSTQTPVTVAAPWPTTKVTAVAGDRGLNVTWLPPYATFSPITAYTATASPGGATCTTPTLGCTINGLTNGTSYTVSVVATNRFGHSGPSIPSSPVAPILTGGGSANVVYLGPLNASTENTSTTVLQRDAGLSVELPNGRELWIFGDTSAFSSASASAGDFIGGSTAAKGRLNPGRSTGLNDIKAAHSSNVASSAQFIPTPTNVVLPDGTGRSCTSANGALYSARWPTGATLLTNQSLVLVTYTDVCVLSPQHFQVEGWGFMEYQWQGGKIRLGPVDVFPPSPSGRALPDSEAFQSPVVSGGRITLYASTCTSLFIACTQGSVTTTTLLDNPFALVNPHSYVSSPTSLGDGSTWAPLNITVAAYPQSPGSPIYRIIEQTSIGGTFKVLQSSSPTGPWTTEVGGTLPGCTSTPSGFCYAFIGHPEVSGADRIIVTYFKPDSNASVNIGHVDTAAIYLPVAHTTPTVTVPKNY